MLASDGVFDNATEDDILCCVNRKDAHPRKTARCIANKSLRLSKKKTYDSPFAINSRAAGRATPHVGGKKDDITVVVSQVILNN